LHLVGYIKDINGNRTCDQVHHHVPWSPIRVRNNLLHSPSLHGWSVSLWHTRLSYQSTRCLVP